MLSSFPEPCFESFKTEWLSETMTETNYLDTCIINSLLGLAIGMDSQVVYFSCTLNTNVLLGMKCQDLF